MSQLKNLEISLTKLTQNDNQRIQRILILKQYLETLFIYGINKKHESCGQNDEANGTFGNTSNGNEVFKQTKVTLAKRVNQNMKFKNTQVHRKVYFKCPTSTYFISDKQTK